MKIIIDENAKTIKPLMTRTVCTNGNISFRDRPTMAQIIEASEAMHIAHIEKKDVAFALEKFLAQCENFFQSQDIDAAYAQYRKYFK